MNSKKCICSFISIILVIILSFSTFASNATKVNNSNASKTTNKANTTNSLASDEADLDLVKLNQTMLYSQLQVISNDYEKYLGKKIRLAGTMNVAMGEEANYYIVECSDTTACCSQGLEFIIKGGSTKPEDYPKTGDRVLVNGTLEKYYEGSKPYIHLVNSECKVLKEATASKTYY